MNAQAKYLLSVSILYCDCAQYRRHKETTALATSKRSTNGAIVAACKGATPTLTAWQAALRFARGLGGDADLQHTAARFETEATASRLRRASPRARASRVDKGAQITGNTVTPLWTLLHELSFTTSTTSPCSARPRASSDASTGHSAGPVRAVIIGATLSRELHRQARATPSRHSTIYFFQSVRHITHTTA